MKLGFVFSAVVCVILLVCAAGCVLSPAAEYRDLVGSPSDYGDPGNWMELPEDVVYPVDVIYFYPTAYVDAEGPLVCEITDAGMREAARHYYEGQATAFASTGNMFAPYYRQLNGAMFAQMTNEEILAGGWGEPRTDVYAALDYYFTHYIKSIFLILNYLYLKETAMLFQQF